MENTVAQATARDEALLVAALPALVGGYMDAYTWVTFRVFANAQTANLVFLWVHVTAAEWTKALHYIPPLAAFAVGVIMASFLRHLAPRRAAQISGVIEIAFLFIIAIIHRALPELALTLGISFVAALKTASFPRVERWAYSSVMATGNFRYAIEGLFAAFAEAVPNRLRRVYVFGLVCAAFGIGAAMGALVAGQMRPFGLIIPVTLLTIVLVLCGRGKAGSND